MRGVIKGTGVQAKGRIYEQSSDMNELAEISNSPLHAKGNLNHMTGLACYTINTESSVRRRDYIYPDSSKL